MGLRMDGWICLVVFRTMLDSTKNIISDACKLFRTYVGDIDSNQERILKCCMCNFLKET